MSTPENELREARATANFGWPVPGDTDAADVPTDLGALADAIDAWGLTAANVPRGTTFPANPRDGQEYDYVADAANGVIWRFRWRAAATARKWEFVGGSELVAVNEAQRSGKQPGGTSTWVSMSGPKLVIPLSGDYMLYSETSMFVTNGGGGLLMQGVTPVLIDYTYTILPGWERRSSSKRVALSAATYEQRYLTQVAGDIYVTSSRLAARPVRVG